MLFFAEEPMHYNEYPRTIVALKVGDNCQQTNERTKSLSDDKYYNDEGKNDEGVNDEGDDDEYDNDEGDDGDQ